MQYSDDRYHLRVDIQAKGCEIPPDERARMQTILPALGEVVQDFPASDLGIKVIHHARSATYHVEFKLKLPGRTLFTGEEDAYLDTAFQRVVNKLVLKVAVYKQQPEPDAAKVAEHRIALDRAVVAPADQPAGPIAEAVRNGDYRAFRTALVGYEDWLRNRIGRWVQRYPEADAQVGDGLKLGDLVEEVYLSAFERFFQRPAELRLSEWLDRLIDPSLKALLRHPDEERENASMARTVRETSLK